MGVGLGSIAESVRETDPRKLAGEVIGLFREHNLLIAAGGIAFRVILATVVGTLFITGALGFFGLDEVWRSDIAPDLRGSVSDDAFRVIDEAVTYVLENKSVFWVTIGAAIAIWQLSGVVRFSGQTLNKLYGVEERRPLPELFADSFKAAVPIAVILLLTLAVIRLGPLALDDLIGDSTPATVVSFLLRWSVAAVLLTVAVGIVVRSAPSIERPLNWISFGSALTVAGWILSSILFGIYVTVLADFGNVYGVLLAVFLLIEYLYVAAIVFLGGLAVDRRVQKRSGS